MQSIGKYQILEKIGVGGFGIVYKGYDPFIKRHVAVKTCTSDDEDTRQRFYREAEIAGNLQHRNIVTVYDFGVQEGIPYLVQEYLSGEDLDHKIKRRDFLAFPQKLFYLIQIARGLEFAHAHGVIHRDIKPANIRVLEDDTAKILDFGIAKAALASTNLTQAGMTLGTASYLSPEQIRGEAVDRRTDIFSFGILAYELLSYRRPFEGPQISAIFYRILNEAPRPLRELWPDGPDELIQLVGRCLEKDPARRYPDCAALRRDLENLRSRRSVDQTVTRPAFDLELAHAPTAVLDLGDNGRRAPREAADSSMVDLELGHRPETPPATTSLRRAAATRRHAPRGLVLTAVGLAGLAALAATAWLLAGQLGGGFTWPGADPRRVTSAPATATPTVAPPSPTPTRPPVTPTATAVPSPTPTPPPRPAVLTVEPGGSTATRVKLGERTFELDHPVRLELPAGSYTITFVSEVPGYDVREESSVRLREGEQRRLENPIPRPAMLTVRPHLNTPQGQVLLDGRPLGATPLQKRLLRPGAHLLEVAPLGEGGTGKVSQTVTLAPGVETVMTFDLSGVQPTRLRDQPVPSP
ncbi:MAG: serine/threonine protein kinase [Holophagales bacterium]|nr:MAG: serine/threonine protein kinase [Holophagales bacterium]